MDIRPLRKDIMELELYCMYKYNKLNGTVLIFEVLEALTDSFVLNIIYRDGILIPRKIYKYTVLSIYFNPNLCKKITPVELIILKI